MSQLTLTFLGVGSAFAKRNWQSNALLEAWRDGPDRQNTPDGTLLIDFGTTGPLALYALKEKPGFGYLDRHGLNNYPAIKNILVTHQHADHVGGLEELAAMNLHVFGSERSTCSFKPRLIGTGAMLESLWTNTLSGGLRALSGREAMLADYFDPYELGLIDNPNPGRVTMTDRFEIALVQTDHVRIHERFDWLSYAVLITDRVSGETVLYSGDTRFDPRLIDTFVAPSRLSFHDVQLVDETEPVHALLSELRALPEPVRRKMYLYHYGDTWDDPAYAFVADEFAGFAVPRHRYTLFE